MKYDIKDVNRYDDIINLPHHVSKTHLPMAIPDRAAQFSPFAALAGYDGAIKETARLTDERVELDEAEKNILDQKLRIVEEQLCNEPEITVTFFQPDEKKVGGAYVSISGIVNKIDYYKRAVLMQDGTRIEIEDISNITGGLFSP
ncbi:MAG: hypothetical protein PHC56_12830 [Herbinix sp.]|nr:hypothetical protein [Herbinix sp.]